MLKALLQVAKHRFVKLPTSAITQSQ